MCVGFTNGYDDFSASRADDALKAMVPGSAISFNRVALGHFAIFLGWAFPRGGQSDPVPLLCHFSGEVASNARVSVRIDDFRDVVGLSPIRVFHCKCSAEKRARVVLDCLKRVGETNYNLMKNNCEHFVREVINGKGEKKSYQARLAVLQIPRLPLGTVFWSSSSSALAMKCCKISLTNGSYGLFDPLMDLLEIMVDNNGLSATVQKYAKCTADFFACKDARFVQELYHSSSNQVVCRPCREGCHGGSLTNCVSYVISDVCRCSHGRQESEEPAELIDEPELPAAALGLFNDPSIDALCELEIRRFKRRKKR
uniref:LRAT domain-containing protein n=1 Tax=Macrostomum lignano TaxID=282301 RepID=A0A1I8G0G9_9PLAT